MKGSRRGTAALGGAALALAAPAAGIDTAPSWETPELVASVPTYFFDFDGVEGQSRYLAFDHFGEPGIGYADGLRIAYARRVPGLGWQSDTVVTQNGGMILSQPALAFDFAEQPTIAYFRDDATPVESDVVRYAPFVDPAWVDEFIGSWFPGIDVTVDRYGVASAFDGLGRIGVAYVRDDSVRFIRDGNGNGTLADDISEGVYNANTIGGGRESVSATVDPLGRFMIAGAHGAGESLRFAVRDTGVGWQSIELATGAEFPSVAVDPDTGFPAVAYQEATGQDLIYAEWDGDLWVTTVVDTTGVTGLWPSLAFDPADGNPAIAYHDQSGGDLKLAWFDGALWSTQVVVDGTIKVPVGFTPSLAFNDFGTGFPAIAYYGIDSGLYFIEDPPRTGDLNADGVVDMLDFLALLAEWGPGPSPADLDGSGTVDVVDLLILLANWG